MNYQITKAISTDTHRLTEIAWQSKKHWNYPAAWMELWRKGLTITPEMIAKHDVFKLLLEDGRIVGYCVLITEEEVLWVEHLWVLPTAIGNGFGTQLLQTALKQTVKPIHKKIKVVSDVNAEVFYQKMGFETVSQYESVPKGRFLPVMERIDFLSSFENIRVPSLIRGEKINTTD